MDTTLILNCIVIFFMASSNIVLIILLFKLNSLNKNILENNKDYVDALSSVMSFLVAQFGQSFDNSKKQQEWMENNIAKLAEINTDNSQKIYDAVGQNQIFLNRLGEFLGYRPRSNLGE